ncbi:MAG: hypothetical protein RCO49_00495 [Rickettsia endosymbiont of Argas persicus]
MQLRLHKINKAYKNSCSKLSNIEFRMKNVLNLLRTQTELLKIQAEQSRRHRQVKRDVNLSIERLKGMIYRIAVTIYQ